MRIGAKEIRGKLLKQIADRVYPYNSELPSSRSLAQELGVSRTTVTAVYEQLAAEGYIKVRHGARPRVALGLPAVESGGLGAKVASVDGIHLSAFGRRITAESNAVPLSRADIEVDFRYGELAAQDFPRGPWKKAVMSSLLRMPRVLSYGDPKGSIRLRRALQGYLWRARNVTCDFRNIIIVNGSQQALDLAARLLLDPGDGFVIENPCYMLARKAFESQGGKAISVNVDEYGIKTKYLENINARVAYVTPSHQYPLGGIMPMARRTELLDWAAGANAWLVEDDYDGEYRYDTKPIPPLQAIDTYGRVIYVGTVSKTLTPTLRIGYVVVPETLERAFTAAKIVADRHTSLNDQEALGEFIESGAYERHIRRQRRKNHHRLEVLTEALHAKFGSRINIAGAKAGLHVVVWIKDLPHMREQELIERGRRIGLGLYSVHTHYDPSCQAACGEVLGLVMGYAALEPERITEGVEMLSRIVDDMR